MTTASSHHHNLMLSLASNPIFPRNPTMFLLSARSYLFYTCISNVVSQREIRTLFV